MIHYAREALDQIAALQSHHKRLKRFEAVRGLDAALLTAEDRISRSPIAGLPAPRPYPGLARAGVAWTKAGRYWIAYSTAEAPTILAVFFEQADIPRRF